MKEEKKKKKNPLEIKGAFITQPISQGDEKLPQSGVSLPDDENVALNKEWVEENKL